MKKTVGFTGVFDFMYVLGDDGRTPVQMTDPLAWAQAGGEGRRDGSWRVAFDQIGKHEVSTVFLGVDHNHGLWEGPPILFETMVFGPDGSPESRERCSTWDEAEKMHQRAVDEVRGRPRRQE